MKIKCGYGYRVTPEEAAQMCAAFSLGKSLVDIGRKFKRPVSTVYYWVRTGRKPIL